jgi:hypothetical protein
MVFTFLQILVIKMFYSLFERNNQYFYDTGI